MRHCREIARWCAVYGATLLLWTYELPAQDTFVGLPLTYARPSTSVWSILESDWRQLSPDGKEWARCITEWHVRVTRRGDSVFIVTRVGDVIHGDNSTMPTLSCDGPLIHAHPSGDCTPSEADGTTAMIRVAKFYLIQCGPRATASYSGLMFELMLSGIALRMSLRSESASRLHAAPK